MRHALITVFALIMVLIAILDTFLYAFTKRNWTAFFALIYVLIAVVFAIQDLEMSR